MLCKCLRHNVNEQLLNGPYVPLGHYYHWWQTSQHYFSRTRKGLLKMLLIFQNNWSIQPTDQQTLTLNLRLPVETSILDSQWRHLFIYFEPIISWVVLIYPSWSYYTAATQCVLALDCPVSEGQQGHFMDLPLLGLWNI